MRLNIRYIVLILTALLLHTTVAVAQQQMQDAFLRSRVDSVSIRTDEDFVPALLSLFKRRS